MGLEPRGTEGGGLGAPRVAPAWPSCPKVGIREPSPGTMVLGKRGAPILLRGASLLGTRLFQGHSALSKFWRRHALLGEPAKSKGRASRAPNLE